MPAPLQTLRPLFAGKLLTSDADMAPFLIDWRKRWQGRAAAVVQPDTTQDVAAVLAWCHAEHIPIVPQGGNTGLSGGSVPDASGQAIVVSLTRLNRIRAADPVNNSLVAEAGCTLRAVQLAAEAVDRLFPLSLAAEGSCTIGGNLATNAGGVHVLRYGTARELCLGLEVVTPTGEIWNGLRALRKNNTGLDLRDLFIGSEGTLGVITAATMRLFPQPSTRVAVFAGVASPQAALQLLNHAQTRIGAGLTAFELLSEPCLRLVLQHVPAARRPLDDTHPWYVLLEISIWGEQALQSHAVSALLDDAIGQGWISDAVISSTEAQYASLWLLRESISEAQAAHGPTIKHDIALPVSCVPDFLDAADQALARHFPNLRLGVFGHLGDGNLHYNVLLTADTGVHEAEVSRCVHDLVLARGGSISAEHGLGVLRAAEAARTLPPVEVAMMRAIRAALDPAGIMNPGKSI